MLKSNLIQRSSPINIKIEKNLTYFKAAEILQSLEKVDFHREKIKISFKDVLENSEEENYLKGLNRAIEVIKQIYHPFLQILMSNYAVNADS